MALSPAPAEEGSLSFFNQVCCAVAITLYVMFIRPRVRQMVKTTAVKAAGPRKGADGDEDGDEDGDGDEAPEGGWRKSSVGWKELELVIESIVEDIDDKEANELAPADIRRTAENVLRLPRDSLGTHRKAIIQKVGEMLEEREASKKTD